MRRMGLAALLFALGTMGRAESFVTVNDRPLELKSNTRCAHLSHSSEQDRCDCCLVQKAKLLHMTPTDALESCNARSLCNWIEYDSSEAAVEEAQSRLKFQTIIDVDRLDSAPILPKDGVLQPSDVSAILKSLQSEGYLHLPAAIFETPIEGKSPLFVKPLGDGAKGHYSGQLFFIGYHRHFLSAQEDPTAINALYILKETKKGVSEIEHLYEIASSPLGQERADTFDIHFSGQKKPHQTKAQIAFDDLHFKLKTNGETRYFSLLQTAPGKSINKHLREFGELARTLDTDDIRMQQAISRMKRIFYRVGYSVSELHQRYAVPSESDEFIRPTYTHGDMHSENVFYDDNTDTVTLIDNETFALSLEHPTSGVDDIVEFYILHTMHTLAHMVSSQLTTNWEFGINDSLWHELCRSMFDGYLDAFGPLSPTDSARLLKEFQQHFYAGLSPRKYLRNPRSFVDQRKLKRLCGVVRRSHLKKHELPDLFRRMELKRSMNQVDAQVTLHGDL